MSRVRKQTRSRRRGSSLLVSQVQRLSSADQRTDRALHSTKGDGYRLTWREDHRISLRAGIAEHPGGPLRPEERRRLQTGRFQRDIDQKFIGWYRKIERDSIRGGTFCD